MLRVLEITASSGYGGGPQHLFELVSHLPSEIIVDIACPRQEPFWDRYNAVLNGEVIEIPERKFALSSAFNLVQHIRKYKINLLHSHGKGAGTYGRFLTALTGLPLLHTPHGIHIDHYHQFMQSVYIAYEKITGRLNHCIIFVSESEQEHANSLKLWSSVQQNVIHNGVRSWPDEQVKQWREELRRSQGIHENEMVVVTLSRFDYPKNMQEMATIAQNAKNMRFWFIGDGVERKQVELYCKDHGLDHVWFAGFVPDPMRYLAAADVYLSTSRWEGLPLSILEAMSLAKPIVASFVTGNRDTIHNNISGYYYQLGNIEQALERLLLLSNDKELRLRMGHEAQDLQKKSFSVGIMSDHILNIYRKIITRTIFEQND